MRHAGGVVIVDEDFTERAAIMTTNKDEFVSQYELGDLEELGLIKIDLLAVEALDRVRACLDLLAQYNYIEKKSTLKETYESAISVYSLERDAPEMWELVWKNKIISLFQMEQGSGIQAISLTKPHSLEDLAAINSVMRLMASERGAEQPLNKYARFKHSHPVSWEQEMLDYGLSKDERKLLREYLDYEYGICATQEDLMSMVQDPKIGGFGLSWADKLRKAVARKNPTDFERLQHEFFENAKEKNLSPILVDYVWNILFMTQRGYSFCAAHTLAYSIIGLQEMNLAYNYPILFWNCANIIVDSMAADLIINNDDEIGFLDDEEEEDEVKSPVNYGRIAKAIGKMTSFGVSVRLPDINKSKLTFSPNVEENSIYYGIKGISKINDKITEEIVLNRPYNSPQDFFNKIKLSKPQAVNIIKSGALDCFGDRVQIMKDYICSISDVKKDLNLRNMQMLMSYNMIPDDLDLERRIFNFNKYIKKSTFGEEYYLTQKAYDFIEENFNPDMVDFFDNREEFIGTISKKEWDKIYTRAMNPVRDYIKANKQKLLDELNSYLMKDMWDKYALGSLSKWEMDSVSFYYHEHELANIRKDIYCISNFFDLSEKPEEEYSFTTRDGFPVSVHKLARIAGTVLDKDKTKHNISLLTEEGVVNVKVWNNQFAKYDKQISKRQADGKKKVIEKSWFSRGNKLILTGIRRGNDFIPKTYKKSEWQYPIQLITEVYDDGLVELKNERESE